MIDFLGVVGAVAVLPVTFIFLPGLPDPRRWEVGLQRYRITA